MQVPFIDLKTQYQALKENIDRAVHTVLDHGFFVNGPEVQQCEEDLAQFTGSKYAVACASGTDALVMALMALEIGPGDEVITTPFSFVATAEAIVLVGATPVLVDIDPKTYNLDPELIEGAITKKTKAIMPVSLYGLMADLSSINTIANKHGLAVIEDAAQSFGAKMPGLNSCAATTISCTSFFPAKPLGCYGDGGAVFTNDERIDLALRQIRDHGSESRYYHTRIGINGRLDTIQCAILSEKLKRYPWEMKQRERVAQSYSLAFQDLESKGVSIPYIPSGYTSVWAQYTLRVPEREKFQAAMKDKGIPTAVHYPTTFDRQPAYKDKVRLSSNEQSIKAANEVVSLPLFPDMEESVQDYAIQQVLNYFK
ncbi:MAG: DegT/DnrJ/EryC1/StrS family aminotransferase [Bdellovibrionales bacterium]